MINNSTVICISSFRKTHLLTCSSNDWLSLLYFSRLCAIAPSDGTCLLLSSVSGTRKSKHRPKTTSYLCFVFAKIHTTLSLHLLFTKHNCTEIARWQITAVVGGHPTFLCPGKSRLCSSDTEMFFLCGYTVLLCKSDLTHKCKNTIDLVNIFK